jgi:tetratricopeptide (TPR) repeat protein
MSLFARGSVRIAIGAALALFVALAIAIGCARRDGEPDGSGPVVDMDLMAFLSEARALHHQANLKEESGDLTGAAAAMERLTNARRPHDGKAPEVEEVLADAYARLAELELRRGSLPKADDAVKNGLVHAPDPTYFRGHLIEVEGLIEEARASSLADAGQSGEAARAREKAIQLLEEVVRIQDQVIQRSLAGRDGQAPASQTSGAPKDKR